jgi:hypothetical protein
MLAPPLTSPRRPFISNSSALLDDRLRTGSAAADPSDDERDAVLGLSGLRELFRLEYEISTV